MKNSIALIDYGMGNLRSVQKAFERVGAEVTVTQNPDDIQRADKIVLPGVGAMQPAMDKLRELNLVDTIVKTVKSGKPFFGICLGFQLLFETGYEGGEVKGLGLFKGTVEKFTQLKVPQMGWNQIQIQNQNSQLFKNIPNESNVYFCHSFFVKPTDKKIIAATTDYGIDYCSAIETQNVFGVQFHPEKSQNIGLNILENFVKL